MRTSGIIVAAGIGTRAGGGLAKQWRTIAGKPMARWSAESLVAAACDPVVVVIPGSEREVAEKVFAGLKDLVLVAGGATRTESVKAGLAALADDPPNLVLIHDAARPFLSKATIGEVIAALADADGAAPALPMADTLKRLNAGGRVSTVDREGLYRVQTPQGFRYDRLMAAFAAAQDVVATDDLAMVETAGGRVVLTPGDPLLFKLTYPEDFAMAERLAGAARVTRVGQGFDAHRFGPGDRVWLCGVDIAHDQGLVGHSDADAALHALTDALLGAVGRGDIGDHFPPSDPKWKGAPSHLFLTHALELVNRSGGRLINVDVTLICERPKIKPHREAMREKLAELLRLPLDRVSVKATTTEGMGFTGRQEGLAAQAMVAVETPA
jgi:2-C-methyl-D-erythritol 4-phosphate cytidylyltransferase/2-C-methyl-D-erythritol 2,4-cyclodiphosphate synthase